MKLPVTDDDFCKFIQGKKMSIEWRFEQTDNNDKTINHNDNDKLLTKIIGFCRRNVEKVYNNRWWTYT